MKIFKLISSNADMEWVFIDASHVRAHQHSAGIKDQDISKSIGGNSSKIHLAVDAMAILLSLLSPMERRMMSKLLPK